MVNVILKFEMNRVSVFGAFSTISIAVPLGIVLKTIQRERTFFDMVIYLTSSKLNLVLFLNCLAVILTNAANLLVTCFFRQVRTVESKYLFDKCQKKIFQFLVLTVVLRNTIDIYKMMTLLVVLSIWMLHWLLAKRTKGLIGEENRDWGVHGRLLTLYAIVISIDGLITYIFTIQFFRNDKSIDDIYLMIGFEVSDIKTSHKSVCLTHPAPCSLPDCSSRALKPTSSIKCPSSS